MATTVKQNGSAKKETTAAKSAVTKKLAQDAVKPANQTPQKQEPSTATKQPVNLLERIQQLEKLKGISAKRERLVETLSSLTRFIYNSSESCSFYLKDSSGLEFKTTNTNLITLIATLLEETLENRKAELEKQLMEFEF